jgi:hypothetical protein
MNLKQGCLVLTMLACPLSAVARSEALDPGAETVTESYADAEIVAEPDAATGPNFSLDIGTSWSRQHLDAGKGSLAAVSLSPAVEWGSGWTLRLYSDWQRIDDVYVVPAATPGVARLCALAAAHPVRVQRLLASGRLTPQQLAVCNDPDGGIRNDNREGQGDTSLGLSRVLPLTDTWLLVPSLTWKEDTGDAYAGLGSGTRDLVTSLDAGRYFDAFTVWAGLVRTTILADHLQGNARDHDSASLLIDVPLTDSVSTGFRMDAMENSESGEPSTLSGSLLGQWTPEGPWSVSSWLTRYRPQADFPEWEYGLALNVSL